MDFDILYCVIKKSLNDEVEFEKQNKQREFSMLHVVAYQAKEKPILKP